MMTLEDALEQRGPHIAAWDRSSRNSNMLSIVTVDRAGAKVIAREKVQASHRAVLEERIASLGILPGGTYRTCDYAWSFGAHGVIVKLDAGIEAEAIGSDIVARGRRIGIASIRSVVSFVDDGDIAHRGVKLLLVNGDEAIVAEETDPAPSIDLDHEGSETGSAQFYRRMVTRLGRSPAKADSRST